MFERNHPPYWIGVASWWSGKHQEQRNKDNNIVLREGMRVQLVCSKWDGFYPQESSIGVIFQERFPGNDHIYWYVYFEQYQEYWLIGQSRKDNILWGYFAPKEDT